MSQQEYNINGRKYRLVEETPEPKAPHKYYLAINGSGDIMDWAKWKFEPSQKHWKLIIVTEEVKEDLIGIGRG